MINNIKTAEYVRKGHPDRVCDIIADSLLDEFIKQDPNSRVAIEIFGCHGIITVGGEVSTNGYVGIPRVVKDVYRNVIGYKDDIGVQVNITEQSPEIHQLADMGAGDSGIMIGYATNETPEMLPIEVVLAKRIANELDKRGKELDLGPDGKIQVTIDKKTLVIKKLIIAYQVNNQECNLLIKDLVHGIIKNLPPLSLDDSKDTISLIPFLNGGFNADTGLTGRKNVLWYGPSIPTGGGAFAGKDATKVDRTGAYLARMIAVKEIQKTQKKESLVEIAHEIGKSTPIYIKIDGEIMDDKKTAVLTLVNVIKILGLNKPIYQDLGLNGHFGNDRFVWR
jgi:S-adenosylmethionine synthetase